MYKRIAKLLAENATPQENRREVLDNDNTERSNITRTAPGWMNTKGAVRKVVSARNRLQGRKTRQPSQSMPPKANTLTNPVRRRTAAEDEASAAAKRASSAAAARRAK